MKQFAYACECKIIWDHAQHPGMAVLTDRNGEILLQVPGEEWTDIQIFTALNLSNGFCGIYVTQKIKDILEIR